MDAAIRMICVFALDRFADFVSDQVLYRVTTSLCMHVHVHVHAHIRVHIHAQ